MKKTLFLILLILILLSGCDSLVYDEEISKIVKNGDYKDCDKLQGEDDKTTQTRIEKCYDAYAQKHEMPELCSKIQEISKHDDCYENLAEKTSSFDLCKQLKGEPDDCISKVGISKNDESICVELDKGLAKDRCNQEIAKNKNSIEICELVESSRYKDNCLEHIALEKQDISICEKLSRYNKEGCVLQLAVNTKNVSLCDYSSEKGKCIERVNSIKQDSEELDDIEKELEDDKELLAELEDETTKEGVNLVDGNIYINSASGKTLSINSNDLPNWAVAEMVVVGASCVCVGPKNTIMTGDENVLLNGLPIARINDKTAHGGTIIEGSDKIFINGIPAAFVGAKTVCPMVTGIVPHVGGPIINNGY